MRPHSLDDYWELLKLKFEMTQRRQVGRMDFDRGYSKRPSDIFDGGVTTRRKL